MKSKSYKRTLLKRFAAVVMCISVTAGTGCTKDEAEINNESEEYQLTLSWWGNDERNAYMMNGVSTFEELNPNIDIICKYGIWSGYKKRQNIYMMSHDEPDVMLINFDWINEYSSDGNGFYDIYSLKDDVDLSTYTESELQYGESCGKLNALPIAFNSQIIYYNSGMYKKYNLEFPKTWDDYFEAAKVMSKDGIYPISMGDKALIFFLGAYLEQTTGKKMCNDNGELIVTKDDIIYMLKFYKKLIDEKALMPLDRSDLNSFVKEESGAVMRWTSGAEIFFQDVIDKGINIEIAPYPMAEGAKTLGWYIKPATLYAISSTTEHPKEAAKLLDFLVNSREMTLLQKTDKGIPISKSAENVLEEEGLIPDLDYRANKQMLDNQEKMSVMYPVLENENVYVSFKSEADYYLYNRSTVEEVAEKIYNDFYSN